MAALVTQAIIAKVASATPPTSSSPLLAPAPSDPGAPLTSGSAPREIVLRIRIDSAQGTAGLVIEPAGTPSALQASAAVGQVDEVRPASGASAAHGRR
jgi:hypothetical protein